MCHRKADNLLLFKSIVDAGSLSTAAKICNISISQDSKRMTSLESSLGLQLLQRSTRKLALTPPGELLYNKLTAIKNQIGEAWQSLQEYGNEPRGELRVTASITFGTHKLMGMIKKFKESHPQINVNLDLNHMEQPPEGSNYDVHLQSHVIEPNELIPDSNLCAKKIESEQLVFVASKTYIEQHGKPTCPEELNQHKCLTLNGIQRWAFYQNGETKTQNLEVEFSTNNFKSLHHAALEGMGIACIPASLMQDDAEQMVQLFDEYTTDTLDTYAYYQSSQMSSKKVSLFIESIKNHRSSEK